MKKLIGIIFAVLSAVFLLPVAATVFLSFYSEGGLTLECYNDLLFDCFVFYPMFWNSVL